MFTLIGYMGLYLVLGVLFLFLIQREIGHGPAASVPDNYLQPTDPVPVEQEV
jgi:cytochrome bd-type quinol oxidase subunit 1